MPTDRQILSMMDDLIQDCRDDITGDTNHTLLAETACQELNAYMPNGDVPDRFFELALQF